ncbi:hypothetical protein MTO96_032569, partial [Rhipicephalus appendiculatus]
MDLPESDFSGSRPNYRAPCTSSEGRLCHIFNELPLCNEFFWPLRLQLRELYPGQLSLVEQLDSPYALVEEQRERATTVLIHLLTHHRCFVSVDLKHWFLFARPTEYEQTLICDALRKSSSLTKLKFGLPRFPWTPSRSLAETLPHLIQLRDLELSYVAYDRTSLEALSELLASTQSLTTFTMTKLFVPYKCAVLILEGLKRNATITKLFVNTSLLSPELPQCGIMFSEYLRSNKTLHTLSVASDSGLIVAIDLHPFIGALFHNDILTELNLTRLVLSELITDMLILNKTLRRFHMIECVSLCGGKFNRNGLDARTNGSFMMSRWLVAVSENKTLQELTLCLDWINPDDYGSLIKALARNTSLKKVTVQGFQDDHVTQICRAVRETRVQDRFVIGKHHIVKDTVLELPECKELSHIGVGCNDVDCFEPLRTALCLLPKCSHVKSLSFEIIHELYSEVSSLMAQYITNTTTLREMKISFIHPSYKKLNAVDWVERTLLQALSLNKSIRRLSIC